MTINVYHEATVFEELHDEWLELLIHSQFPQPFSTPAFLQTCWEVCHDSTLQIITIRDQQQKLQAILPLVKDRHGVTRLLGHPDLFDYADLLVNPAINSTEMISWIREALSKVDLTHFKFYSLSKQSWLYQHAAEVLDTHTSSATQQTVCPQLSLPTTWETYLQNLERKQRQEIRRKMRKTFAEFPAEYELITDQTQLEPAIQDFIHLHQLSSPSKKQFWTEKNKQFFRN